MPATAAVDARATIAEFERQLQTLIDASFPAVAGISESAFRALVEPLHARLADLPAPKDETALPFVIVLGRDVVPTASAMAAVVDGRGRSAVVDMDPVSPDDFTPKEGVEIPADHAYLLADVDLGAWSLGVRPEDALPLIERRGRTPLTIDEGVAVLTQFPDVLDTHHAYQLLASRQQSKRIPSIWRSYGRPRLGWCWDGAPHSWMGSASAAARLGRLVRIPPA